MYFINQIPTFRKELLFCTTELSSLVFLTFSLDNPSQVGSVSVTIKVLDVNDNAPEFPRFYEAFVCENAKAGQVRKPLSQAPW
jgi:hypothetical protein